MPPETSFWQAMTELLATNAVIIDRPKGSSHPRFPGIVYPLDYGYLENTTAGDGGGIDVWLGSLSTAMDKERPKTLTGILCTFDRLKRDAEIKLLVGCTEDDLQIIRNFHQPKMHLLYIPNPMAVRP
jgi:inorganic pyrophosphatase